MLDEFKRNVAKYEIKTRAIIWGFLLSPHNSLDDKHSLVHKHMGSNALTWRETPWSMARSASIIGHASQVGLMDAWNEL